MTGRSHKHKQARLEVLGFCENTASTKHTQIAINCMGGPNSHLSQLMMRFHDWAVWNAGVDCSGWAGNDVKSGREELTEWAEPIDAENTYGIWRQI